MISDFGDYNQLKLRSLDRNKRIKETDFAKTWIRALIYRQVFIPQHLLELKKVKACFPFNDYKQLINTLIKETAH